MQFILRVDYCGWLVLYVRVRLGCTSKSSVRTQLVKYRRTRCCNLAATLVRTQGVMIYSFRFWAESRYLGVGMKGRGVGIKETKLNVLHELSILFVTTRRFARSLEGIGISLWV